MHHLIGANKYGQYPRQCGQALQVFRQPLAAHDVAHDPATHDAEQAAAHNHPGEGQQAVTQALTCGAGDDKAINHHREQRANRVDDDAFPAQYVGN